LLVTSARTLERVCCDAKEMPQLIELHPFFKYSSEQEEIQTGSCD